MWIHVICGAGASSTFVARRLEKAAGAADIAMRVSAGSFVEAGGLPNDPDLMLLGAHLAQHEDQLRAMRPGSRVVVLEGDAAQDFDGTRTLAFVMQRIAADSPTRKKETP